MATLDLKQYRYNDFLNKVESTVKTVDAVPNRDRNFNCINCEPQRHINVGDLIHIGNVPMNVLVTDIKVIYKEGFPNCKFDIGFLGDNLSFQTFATDVHADLGAVVQNIPVGSTGCRNPDGSDVPDGEMDFRGSIWNDDIKPLTFAIKMKSDTLADGDPIKVGKMRIIFSFIRFGEEDYTRGDRILYPLDYID